MSTADRIVDPETAGQINEEDLLDQTDNTDEQETHPEIPAKFRNKSLEDVIQSYTELEKAYGRQSNDFGELRKLTDSILLKQLESEKVDEQPQREAVEFEDFVQDPEGSIDRVISKKLKPIQDKLSEKDKLDNMNAFEKKHTDWRDHVSTDEFQEWVHGSAYRTELFKRADQYDFGAADELFSTWKERKELLTGRQQEAEQQRTAQRNKDLKNVSTETGSTGQSSGKTFRRADLIRMRVEEPAKYQAMSEEIREAYQQGRVK